MGSNGFLGSHVAERLVTAGHDVINLDDYASKHGDNLKGVDCIKIEGDATDAYLVYDLVKTIKPDIIINFAVRALEKSFEWSWVMNDMQEVIINIPINCLEAIRWLNKDILYVQISSSEVFGTATEFPTPPHHPFRPATLYAACKASVDLITESYSRCYGIPIMIIRPFNMVGERQPIHKHGSIFVKTLIRLMQGKQPVIYGDGKQTRDYTYVGDVADGIVKAITHKGLVGKVVQFSGHEIYMLDVIEYCVYTIEHDGTDVPHGFISKDPRPGDNKRMCGDHGIATIYLGWKPKTFIGAAVKKLYDWIKKQVAEDPSLLKKIGDD